jgi:two-component system alkaline phosphatase synthesis response regulator PhoP
MEKRILIVDDEPHIRLLLEQTLEELEDEGVELLTAGNGEEAIEIIKNSKPELVFLDVMMPRMNGFDVCNVVKNNLGIKDVYIIMLTAKGQEFDKQKGREAGADMYMTKPFSPDEVVEKALEVLALSGS